MSMDMNTNHSSCPGPSSPGPCLEDLKVFLQRHPGLRSLNDECYRVYPTQPNPLQIKSLVKCWMGGPDPLDYISMYSNSGNMALGIPPHWHYITYGLSDLYGDGRLFPIDNPFGEEKSGFGFELTFRLLRSSNETVPPTWPATLLQSIARYVFASAQMIKVGDHIAWHNTLNLDDQTGENDQLRHMITIKDPELSTLQTPQGYIEFVQIVPVTNEELVAVQSWNVPSFADLMARIPDCGGPYLVADMRRKLSVLALYPEFIQDFNEGVDRDGSDLLGANARFLNFCDDVWKFFDSTNIHLLKPEHQAQLRQLKGIPEKAPQPEIPHLEAEPHETRGNDGNQTNRRTKVPDTNDYRNPKPECSDCSSSSSDNSDGEHEATSALYDVDTDVMLSAELGNTLSCDSKAPEPSQNSSSYGPKSTNSSSTMSISRLDTSTSLQIHYFDTLHVTVDLEAGLVMPIALKGRLRLGRSFTFNGLTNMLTFAPPGFPGLFVNTNKKYAVCLGPKNVLQIMISDELLNLMIRDFDEFMAESNCSFPKTMVWPEHFLAITIVLN